jgi:hypothetical protein
MAYYASPAPSTGNQPLASDSAATHKAPERALAREGLLLAGALAGGALLLPLLIWVVGGTVLGPYPDGGPLRLLGDFMRLLAQGSLAAWIILWGPYLALSLARVTLALWRRFPR